LITFAVYSPGLDGDFEFDDSINILENRSLVIDNFTLPNLRKAAFSGNSGPLKRPISMISFAFNYYLTGPDPYFFKLTNVVIHLINGFVILIFSILVLLTYQQQFQSQLDIQHIRWIALFATLIWLLHPLNLTSVLYIVQRMTSLSSLFTMVALCFYIAGRQKLNQKKTNTIYYFFATFTASIISIYCKEIGFLIPFYILLIEALLFHFKTNNPKTQKILIYLIICSTFIPIIFSAIYFLYNPEWLLEKFQIRNFDLTHRLFTESRALWFYLSLIFVPNISRMGLYHDDFIISSSLISPITTLMSIMGIVILILLAIKYAKKIPILSFGIAWFLFGHILESTILPLELVHEHRNYLPMFGLILSVSYFLINPFFKKILPIRYLTLVTFTVLLGISTAIRSSQWGNLVEHAAVEVHYHPKSFRANYQLGRIYFILYNNTNDELYINKAEDIFEQTAKLESIDNGALFALYLIEMLNLNKKNSVFPTLLNNLRNNHLAPNTLAYLLKLSDCLAIKKCVTKHEKFISLYQAIIANPYVTNHVRTLTESQLAFYYARIVGDVNRAYQLMNEIVIKNPDSIKYRLALMSLLEISSRQEEIANHLEIAKKLDKFDVYQNKLIHYTQLLREYDQKKRTMDIEAQ